MINDRVKTTSFGDKDPTSSLKGDQWLMLSHKPLGFALRQSEMLSCVIPMGRQLKLEKSAHAQIDGRNIMAN